MPSKATKKRLQQQLQQSAEESQRLARTSATASRAGQSPEPGTGRPQSPRPPAKTTHPGNQNSTAPDRDRIGFQASLDELFSNPQPAQYRSESGNLLRHTRHPTYASTLDEYRRQQDVMIRKTSAYKSWDQWCSRNKNIGQQDRAFMTILRNLVAVQDGNIYQALTLEEEMQASIREASREAVNHISKLSTNRTQLEALTINYAGLRNELAMLKSQFVSVTESRKRLEYYKNMLEDEVAKEHTKRAHFEYVIRHLLQERAAYRENKEAAEDEAENSLLNMADWFSSFMYDTMEFLTSRISKLTEAIPDSAWSPELGYAHDKSYFIDLVNKHARTIPDYNKSGLFIETTFDELKELLLQAHKSDPVDDKRTGKLKKKEATDATIEAATETKKKGKNAKGKNAEDPKVDEQAKETVTLKETAELGGLSKRLGEVSLRDDEPTDSTLTMMVDLTRLVDEAETDGKYTQEMLKTVLRKFLDQYAVRDRYYQSILAKRELDLQMTLARLAKAKKRAAAERASFDSLKVQLNALTEFVMSLAGPGSDNPDVVQFKEQIMLKLINVQRLMISCYDQGPNSYSETHKTASDRVAELCAYLDTYTDPSYIDRHLPKLFSDLLEKTKESLKTVEEPLEPVDEPLACAAPEPVPEEVATGDMPATLSNGRVQVNGHAEATQPEHTSDKINGRVQADKAFEAQFPVPEPSDQQTRQVTRGPPEIPDGEDELPGEVNVPSERTDQIQYLLNISPGFEGLRTAADPQTNNSSEGTQGLVDQFVKDVDGLFSMEGNVLSDDTKEPEEQFLRLMVGMAELERAAGGPDALKSALKFFGFDPLTMSRDEVVVKFKREHNCQPECPVHSLASPVLTFVKAMRSRNGMKEMAGAIGDIRKLVDARTLETIENRERQFGYMPTDASPPRPAAHTSRPVYGPVRPPSLARPGQLG